MNVAPSHSLVSRPMRADDDKYAVRITWANGQILKATVTRKTLCGFKLSACRDASVFIARVHHGH